MLEALGSTRLNLLLKVGFNTEVAKNGALYWTKRKGSLSDLIQKADAMSEEEIMQMGQKAKARIQKAYTWNYIIDKYETLFLTGK